MARTLKRRHLEIDSLEGRRLLNGRVEHALAPSVVSGFQNGVPVASRGINYTTPQGAKVSVQVLGNGSIAGTSIDPDGALNLVYSGTNAASQIQINVRGGTAPLRSVRNLNLALNNFTGIGGQLLGMLQAPSVDLIDNGSINLTSGIGRLQLHSIGRNTQIHLRELPQTLQTTTSSGSSSSGGGSSFSGSGSSSSSLTFIPKLAAGDQAITAGLPPTAIAPSTFVEAGRTFTYSNDANGGSTLQAISGLFAPGGNLVVSPAPTPPATDLPPPGVIVQVDQINAGNPGQATIGNGQLFGYDPTANALVRFDEQTGAPLRLINVGGTPTTSAGVGLGRNGRELVVLLGRGTTVQAFDAITGAPVGQFNASTIGGVAFTGITGIAFNELSTTLTDANAQLVPGSADFGVAVSIDVSASLATGRAQAIGSPYGTSRAVEFAGGATGVAGSTNLYATIGSPFDPFQFQPAQEQLGILTLSDAGGTPAEAARTAIRGTGSNPFVNAGLPGSLRGSGTTRALGSVENLLALVTGVTNGQNVATLFTPQGISPVGTLTLNDPNRLVSLSGSFHPELAGSALVDVQGNLQAFNARTAHGLALNDSGNLNQVKITSIFDSTIIGQPVSHLDLARRSNVTVVSPNRSVGTRGGVTIDHTLRPLGPLSLPG